MLTISEVSKGFGGRTLFADVSVQINRGDRLGLVGPNGAGKSTLLGLILGTESPDGGNLYYLAFSVVSPVWRLPTSGGGPVKVLDGVVWFNFCLVEKGAYYVDRFGSDVRLQYLNFVTGKDVQVDVKIDPAIIGGLVVKLGSRMVDSSLRTKLNMMKHAMKEAS